MCSGTCCWSPTSFLDPGHNTDVLAIIQVLPAVSKKPLYCVVLLKCWWVLSHLQRLRTRWERRWRSQRKEETGTRGHSIKKKRKQKWKNELGIEGTEWQKKAAGKEIETAESQRKRTEIVATILFSFLQIGFLPEVRCPQKVFSAVKSASVLMMMTWLDTVHITLTAQSGCTRPGECNVIKASQLSSIKEQVSISAICKVDCCAVIAGARYSVLKCLVENYNLL